MMSRLGLFIGLLLLTWGAVAQETTGVIWEVFLERDVTEAGADRLTFIDVLTGESTETEVTGANYTPLDDSILYYDWQSRGVMVAFPNGETTSHPFITLDGSERRVDWVLSPDGKVIAWTITIANDVGELLTTTSVADIDGRNVREILVDGPRSGVRALPVAFNNNATVLYMDIHPDAASQFLVFAQYAGLFAVDLDSGELTTLPNEPECFCGAGLGAGLFVRLAITNDLNGYDVRIYDLAGEVDFTIPAFRLRDYNQAGDVIISPNGDQAVYALARIDGIGTDEATVRTVFMLVDLQGMSQRTLNDPITTYVHPLGWTEDNTALLFTSPRFDGTWKINLSDGELSKVADATYIGRLQRDR